MSRRRTRLHLGDGWSVPLDAATESWGFLGQRGSGKSNGLVVIAEELHDTGVPWVAIDPKGDWWGIRSDASGKGPGLSTPVFGGLHGDIPLEPTAGAMVANLLVDENLTAVLDVSRMTGADRSRFLIGFCHTLFDRHQAEPHVRTVIFEEAHLYIPQSVTAATAALKEATAKIPLEGRAFGLGSITASQRSSRLHKDVLTQFSIMVAMRSPAKLDRDAIGGWVEEHDVSRELLASLPSLHNGEAWIWSPHALGIAERHTFRRRRTFDSGATPKVGEAKRTPKTIADVDLAAITAAMAATVERAKDNDPAQLRQRIRELQGQLAKAPTEPVVQVEYVVPQGLVGVCRAMLDAASGHVTELSGYAQELHDELAKVAQDNGKPAPARHRETRGTPTPAELPKPPTAPATRRETAVPADVTKAHMRVLDAVARLEVMGLPSSRAAVALLSRYSHTGGAYGNNVSRLRTLGLLDYPADGMLALTDAGRAIADPGDAPATDAELQDEACRQVGPARAKLLRELLRVYPQALTRTQLADATDNEATGGAFGNKVSRLHTLGLVDYPDKGHVVASDNLFLRRD